MEEEEGRRGDGAESGKTRGGKEAIDGNEVWDKNMKMLLQIILLIDLVSRNKVRRLPPSTRLFNKSVLAVSS
jgi:hypothetical protein